MVFWLVLGAIVVVALIGLAWWSSGRNTSRTPPGGDRAQVEADALKKRGPGGDPTHQGGFGY